LGIIKLLKPHMFALSVCWPNSRGTFSLCS